MLDVVVPFTVADAICDTDFAVGRMSNDVEAFGLVGHDVVVKFKEAELVSRQKTCDQCYKTFYGCKFRLFIIS